MNFLNFCIELFSLFVAISVGLGLAYLIERCFRMHWKLRFTITIILAVIASFVFPHIDVQGMGTKTQFIDGFAFIAALLIYVVYAWGMEWLYEYDKVQGKSQLPYRPKGMGRRPF